MTLLLIFALVPPIFLLVQVYRMDRIEKEPLSLILRLFLLGALMVVPAALIERRALPILSGVFGTGTLSGALVENFIGVALVEELCKYVVLKAGSWRSRHFNYCFDAIVYSAAVTLGFAAVENIGYVGSYGLSVALLRAVTSIPGHCIFGIFMGYYLGAAKLAESMGREGKRRHCLRMAILMPVLLHGAYDFIASSGQPLLTLLFYGYVIALDIFALRAIRRFSAEDHTVV